MQRLFSNANGGVARDLGRRALRVQNAAKLNATGRQVVGATNPEGRGPRVDTGRLRSSIAIDVRQDSQGVVARIGTNVEYGYYLETGLRNGATYPFLLPALPAARG
ncbi:MAG TPA: HK97 gp10 family phage protein [Candidatus Limnocylindrales bacterium]|nr:HK97 gp10 family phage protein [Candidatus Limnocylindrales bacterium]